MGCIAFGWLPNKTDRDIWLGSIIGDSGFVTFCLAILSVSVYLITPHHSGHCLTSNTPCLELFIHRLIADDISIWKTFKFHVSRLHTPLNGCCCDKAIAKHLYIILSPI
jgi:hypothetical protein